MKIYLIASYAQKAQTIYNEIQKDYKDFIVDNYNQADAIVIIGGDGFLLHALHTIITVPKPIYGINSGRIGFLLNSYNQEDNLIKNIQSATAYTLPSIIYKATNNQQNEAYNEVIFRNELDICGNFTIIINNNAYITDLSADGVLVSTTTGSSAYNSALNGCMVAPGINCIVITPIGNYNHRNWRGGAIPLDSNIKIKNNNSNQKTYIKYDNQKHLFTDEVILTGSIKSKYSILFNTKDYLLEKHLRMQFGHSS